MFAIYRAKKGMDRLCVLPRRSSVRIASVRGSIVFSYFSLEQNTILVSFTFSQKYHTLFSILSIMLYFQLVLLYHHQRTSIYNVKIKFQFSHQDVHLACFLCPLSHHITIYQDIFVT